MQPNGKVFRHLKPLKPNQLKNMMY